MNSVTSYRLIKTFDKKKRKEKKRKGKKRKETRKRKEAKGKTRYMKRFYAEELFLSIY